MGFSQTLVMSGGYALDLAIGAYAVPVRPDLGPKWQLKFGITMLFPR